MNPTTPPTLAITVIHATPLFAVIDKPAGMLSVPGKGADKADCAAARVRTAFPDATGPLVVHRLDMDTSGLLVFGLTPDSQRELSRQFEARVPQKAYVALVDGEVRDDEGRIDLPMRPDVANRPWQMIDYIHGRHAATRFRVLARETDRTRVRLEPITGRAHQLRLHAAISREQGGLGCPILGDVLYAPWPPREKIDRLMLHAAELGFADPRTGAMLHFSSQVPF